MSQTPNTAIAVIGIDIGKNSFHVVGHDARGAIVLRQKWSRGQVEARLANIPPCLRHGSLRRRTSPEPIQSGQSRHFDPVPLTSDLARSRVPLPRLG